MTHKIFRLVSRLFLGLAVLGSGLNTQVARAAGPWYAIPTGNDNNDCLSPSTPCGTINGAIGKATAGDTINVAVGTYTGSGTEVVLIDKDITLSGGWDASFTTQSGISSIDGQESRRGMTMNSSVTATVQRFALQNGNVTGNGGGIYNAGNLTVTNSVISNNIAGSGTGSGVFNADSGIFALSNSNVSHNGSDQICFTLVNNNGTFAIDNSVIEENTSSPTYCALLTVMNFSGTMVLTNTAIRNNSGGIYNYATLTLNSSVISGNVNTASNGPGGIYTYGGILNVNNSTISGNTTSSGGGIFAGGGGTVRLNNSTVSNNTASTGGGIYNDPNVPAPADIIMQNTILAGNTASGSGQDCLGTITNSDHNIIGDTTDCAVTAGTSDQFNVDPLLGAFLSLQGYYPLLSSSPAIDAGDNITCLNLDQRGVTRPQGATCDIGAYEYTMPGPAVSLSVAGGDNQSTTTTLAFPEPFQTIALDNQGSPVSGVTVTFTAPGNGASGTFVDTGTNTTSVDTDAGGVATTSTFTANDQGGVYTVSASAAGVGSVNFSLEQVARPTNDNFTNAQGIALLPFTATVDITNATNEPSEQQNCYSMDRTVWYSFTPTETMLIRANTQGSTVSGIVSIYYASGPVISDLQFLGCSSPDGSPTFIVEANQTYYLQVGAAFGEVGNIQINLEQVPPVANDDFANAVSVGALPFSDTRDTSTATSALDDPVDCYNNGSVWYQFTPSGNTTITAMANTFGSDYDTTLAVYTGSRGALELIPGGCNDDFSSLQSRVVFNATGGTTYYFMVGFCCGNGGTGGGNLIFSVEEYVPVSPQASFSFDPSEPSTTDTIQFYDGSYDPENIGIETWEWDFGDGSPLSTDQYPTHLYSTDGDYDVTLTVTTFDGRSASTTQTVQVRTQFTYTIDIKPGSQTNPINPGSSSKIPVAILSTPDFNAPLEVDRASLTFGSTGNEHSLVSCNKKGTDVNGDGLKDLMCHFKTKLAGFKFGDTEGILRGLTLGGVSIEARDVVRVLHASYP